MKQAWHYEFTEINNPKSELMYKGKLYDEMKEFFQNPNNIFKETVKNQLYVGDIENCFGGF